MVCCATLCCTWRFRDSAKATSNWRKGSTVVYSAQLGYLEAEREPCHPHVLHRHLACQATMTLVSEAGQVPRSAHSAPPHSLTSVSSSSGIGSSSCGTAVRTLRLSSPSSSCRRFPSRSMLVNKVPQSIDVALDIFLVVKPDLESVGFINLHTESHSRSDWLSLQCLAMHQG